MNRHRRSSGWEAPTWSLQRHTHSHAVGGELQAGPRQARRSDQSAPPPIRAVLVRLCEPLLGLVARASADALVRPASLLVIADSSGQAHTAHLLAAATLLRSHCDRHRPSPLPAVPRVDASAHRRLPGGRKVHRRGWFVPAPSRWQTYPRGGPDHAGPAEARPRLRRCPPHPLAVSSAA
jgi:hypothetical protein